MHHKEVLRNLKAWEDKGLVQHPDVALKHQRELKKVRDTLPPKKLTEMLRHFKIQPLLQQLDIYRHAITHGTISPSDEAKLTSLERTYQELSYKKPMKHILATDFEDSRMVVKKYNPNTEDAEDILKFLLIQNGACYADKRRLDEIVDAFHHDSLFGGSVLTSVETKRNRLKPDQIKNIERKIKKDNPVMAVGKYFICLDKDGKPTLAADMYSHGDYQSRSLLDWQEAGKSDLFAYGPASMLYIGQALGIDRFVFCDLEMEDFAKRCGIGKKTVFKRFADKTGETYDDRKVGVITVGNNSKGVWHHNHSIYSRTNGRYTTLDYSPISMDVLYGEFTGLHQTTRKDLKQKNNLTPQQFKKKRVDEKFNAMYSILRIMEDLYLGNRQFEQAKHEYNALIDTAKQRNDLFSRQYVR